MNLKSFGCSFIFGSELSDDGRTGPYATGSCLTWPALLAKEFGYGYHTYARPGSGNLQIAERALYMVDNFGDECTVTTNHPPDWAAGGVTQLTQPMGAKFVTT